MNCPECGGQAFIRAVRVERFRPAWLPWLMPRMELLAYKSVCDNCSTAVVITRNGISRLRVRQPEQAAAGPPVEREVKPQMRLNVTPEHQWTRTAR